MARPGWLSWFGTGIHSKIRSKNATLVWIASPASSDSSYRNRYVAWPWLSHTTRADEPGRATGWRPRCLEPTSRPTQELWTLRRCGVLLNEPDASTSHTLWLHPHQPCGRRWAWPCIRCREAHRNIGRNQSWPTHIQRRAYPRISFAPM